MSARTFMAAMLVIAAAALWGCQGKEQSQKVDLEKRAPVETMKADNNKKHIRIAVGGMITPKEGLAYYRKFLDYVGERLDVKVDYVDREDYAEINELLRKGDLDAAFVCSGPYVDGQREFGLELLAAPQAYGETVYYSYIIVAKDSPVKTFEDLKGKTFAFSDPLSNTGKLVPAYMLARMKETPETFFKSFVFTHAHDKSIKAVAQGIVDGAAVDSLIWEFADRTNPEFTSRTRIIKKSPPYAIPPVAVPKGLDPDIKKRLKDVFLNADKDPKGRELLSKMMIDRFVPIEDKAYDSIREMKAWTDRKSKGK